MDSAQMTGLVDVFILVLLALIGAVAGLLAGRVMMEDPDEPNLWMVDANHPDQYDPADAAYAGRWTTQGWQLW